MKWYSLMIFVPLSMGITASAQKDLLIHEDLKTNAEKMKVKMGTQWMGKIWKFKFGEYAVGDSKMGWTVTSERGNFFNTKTESKSTEKFSFNLNTSTKYVATVNAANNILIRRLNEIDLLPHVTWGNDEILQANKNFSAFISVNGDTTNTWALLLNEQAGSEVRRESLGVLTNGQRKITISLVTSNKEGEEKALPAMGYEFIEDAKPLCAVQYYGGGMMGMNKNVVWLHRDNDEFTKLILAAAMTAILQVKATSSAL
jgi:hypothetical protein